MSALNFLVDDRLTRIDDAAVMSFDGIGELRHRFANGFADEIIRATVRSFPPARC